MLELLYTSTKTLTFSTGSPGFAVYIASWDALAFLAGTKLYRVFRDGTQLYLGDTYQSWNRGNREKGLLFYFSYETNSWCYAADEITAQLHDDLVLNPDWKVPSAAGSFIDDSNGLYLKVGTSIAVYRLSDGVQINTISPGFTTHNLAYAGSGWIMAFNYTTGDVALINYLGNQILWKSKIRPCKWSAYDCNHNLIISIETDKLVRVYLLTPVPATLTAPTFTPAAKRYQGCVVQTRLTGADGEICSGYLVHWELLGVPPKGALLKASTLTDSNGYAENFYFSPGEGETIGAETLRARVVI